MATVFRAYRVAPAGHVNPPAYEGTRPRQRRAYLASLRVRRALEAGRIPAVTLVGPERADRSRIGPDGTVSDVWAWKSLHPTDWHHAQIVTGHTDVPDVVAVIDTDDYAPDHASQAFADAGSVVVRRGRVTDLIVARWLAPVAPDIAGAHPTLNVVLSREGRDRWVPVEPAPPLVSRGVLTDDECDLLIEHHRQHASHQPRPDASSQVLAPAQGRWGDRLRDIAALGSEHFGLPVDRMIVPHVARYDPGTSHAWHVDMNIEVEPWRAPSTVSFSALLSRPDVDYRGGQLETDDGVVDLGRGDVASFTALTRHAVREVTQGARYVLVGFCSQL